jgi:hypothetical protein
MHQFNKIRLLYFIFILFYFFGFFFFVFFFFFFFCFFFLNHCCFVVQLEARDGDSPRSSLIVENSFHYPGCFVIPDEFENCSFYLCEQLSWNFDGDCIESIDCFW